MAKGASKAVAKAQGGAKASGGGKVAAGANMPRTTSVCVNDGKRERTVEVRKIENGYIVRESSYGGKQGYTSTERFVDKAPVLDIKTAKSK